MNTTTSPVRRFTPDFTTHATGMVEATDGGAYIRVGDVELAIVPPDQSDADRTFASAVQAHAAISELVRLAPSALADLDALIAELGTPCTTCDGWASRIASVIVSEGHVSEVPGPQWSDCITCGGVGRVPASKVAA